MYIAMNRFKIIKGNEDTFENLWKNRYHEVEGFLSFNLIKGKSLSDHTLYASHSTWKSEEDFISWTKSQVIQKSSQRCRN